VAVPALVQALKTDAGLAATALVRIGGGEDPQVITALLAALEKAPADELGISVSLCHAVCRYGGDLEPCLASLLAALDDRNPMVRRQAAEALGCWGPKAKGALPRLRTLMAEGDVFYEGLAAAAAVWQITGEHAPTYEYAMRAAKNSQPTSWMAVHTLRLLGPHAAEAVPVLVGAALGWRRAFWRQEDVMKEATLALGAIGPAAAEALPVLRELEHNHLVREEARRAIEQIEKR
jgi:HEAT repeat protein